MFPTAIHPLALAPDSPPLDTPSPAPYSSTPVVQSTANGEASKAETGYFDGFDRESTLDDDEADESERPQLKSRSTLRATAVLNPSSPYPVPTQSPALPRYLSFPRPPHLLPPESLSQLPTPHLIALVVALSRELSDSNESRDRSSRVNHALEEILSDKGISEGELERVRLRAGVAGESLETASSDWQIALSLEDSETRTAGEVPEFNQRRNRKSIVPRDQTEVMCSNNRNECFR